MHIDVINWCANKFGDHHESINRYVSAVRKQGVAVVGVTYNSNSNNCRQLSFEEVSDSFTWDQSVKVEPAPQDFLFQKIKPSALKDTGSHVLAEHIARCAPQAILVCGYYEDHCVYQTVVDMASRFRDTKIYVLGDLCRALQDEAAFDGIARRYANVAVIQSDSVVLQSRPPGRTQRRGRNLARHVA